MGKLYDLSKLDLSRFAETLWHIRAIYDEMVNYGRIGKFSDVSSDRYERGQYRSVYFEIDQLTDIAYEFSRDFEIFMKKYNCDYEDALVKLAEERLPKIFNGKPLNIERTTKREFSEEITHAVIITDRTYKRLAENHKLDSSSGALSLSEYSKFISDIALDFSYISELSFGPTADIDAEIMKFAEKKILEKFGGVETISKRIIDTINCFKDCDLALLLEYLRMLDFFKKTVRPFVEEDSDAYTRVTASVLKNVTDSETNLKDGIVGKIEGLLSSIDTDEDMIANMKRNDVQEWIFSNIDYVIEKLEPKEN